MSFESLTKKLAEIIEAILLMNLFNYFAADLALRCCLREDCNHEDALNGSGTDHLKGLAIATCCHHLCQWKDYISNQFILPFIPCYLIQSIHLNYSVLFIIS